MELPTKGNQRLGFAAYQVVILVMCALILQSLLLPSKIGLDMEFLTHELDSSSPPAYDNPLAIPRGQAQNLPSVRTSQDFERDESGTNYGGVGDAKHLGGFTDIDMMGISPAVWKHIVKNWTVQSVIDVGCGRGISTSWFYVHGLRTECVEGSHDAIEQSMVPDKSILTEHDFSRGPWWPQKTFDVVWSVEFLEHVNRQFHFNYVSTFRKAAILMVSSSAWGGWHHVEVHDDKWWIRKFESYGFRFAGELTREIRDVATQEQLRKEIFPPNGMKYTPQHIWTSMKIFINPLVAALPEHAHLFGEPGCFQSTELPNRECGKPVQETQAATAKVETPLDPSYYSLELTPEQDQVWYDIVKANIRQPDGEDGE